MSAGTAWVIERYRFSQLEYFSDVSGLPSRFVVEWSQSFEAATKFADKDSAARFMAHACDGIGRVVEHAYCVGSGGVLTKSATA
jgi:hypothetical protein